eukprot:6489419-Amphidinium_carterae.1
MVSRSSTDAMLVDLPTNKRRCRGKGPASRLLATPPAVASDGPRRLAAREYEGFDFGGAIKARWLHVGNAPRYYEGFDFGCTPPDNGTRRSDVQVHEGFDFGVHFEEHVGNCLQCYEGFDFCCIPPVTVSGGQGGFDFRL